MSEAARPTRLIVDDDERTRTLMSAALAGADFNILEAKGGLDGISTMLRYEGEIALAVVEINLPGVNGLDLANQIGIERPTTEVLYVSDLVESIAVKSVALQKPEAVLPKPFTARQLVARVRQFVPRDAAGDCEGSGGGEPLPSA